MAAACDEGIAGKNVLYADFSLLFVALIWGGGFVVIKDALQDISPFYMMALRFVLAFLLMTILFARSIRKTKKSDLVAGAIIGFFLFAAYGSQTVGLQYTTAGKQAFLTGANVVMVPFLYWMLSKKRPDLYAIAGAFMCLFGIGLLTLQNGLAISRGDTLTLASAFFFACHITAVGFFAKKSDPVVLSILQTGYAAIIFVVCAVLFEPPLRHISSGATAAIAYQVLLSTLAAVLIQNVAQKYTTSTHAAIILCLESVFGSLLAVLFLGDVFSGKMIIGCVLIFAAIITSETRLSFLHADRRHKAYVIHEKVSVFRKRWYRY